MITHSILAHTMFTLEIALGLMVLSPRLRHAATSKRTELPREEGSVAERKCGGNQVGRGFLVATLNLVNDREDGANRAVQVG